MVKIEKCNFVSSLWLILLGATFFKVYAEATPKVNPSAKIRPAINIIKNGNFAKLVPKEKAYGKKAIKDDKGLDSWGHSGTIELIKHSNRNFLKMEKAQIYSRLPVKRVDGKQVIKGILRASGNGRIIVKARIDTNWKNQTMLTIAVLELGKEPKDFKFEIPLEAQQGVILYIYAAKDVLLESVSGTVENIQK